MQDNTPPEAAANKQAGMHPTSRGGSLPWWQTVWASVGSYVAVALGSVVGGVARYLVSVLFASLFGSSFPWSTLFVNVTGSFIIGFYSALTSPDGRFIASTRQRQFVMIGICGGYTTFSSFSLETLRLVQSGEAQTALLNLLVSITGWMAAVWIGHALAMRINRLRET
jgi:CrcB protein